MSDKTKRAAEAVKKWLDGGASTWGYPESQIRHLANIAPILLSALEQLRSANRMRNDHEAELWDIANDAIEQAEPKS